MLMDRVSKMLDIHLFIYAALLNKLISGLYLKFLTLAISGG